MDWLFNPSKIFDVFLSWIATGILNSFDAIFSAIGKSLLKSPDVTGLPQVQALTGRSVLVVDTVFVLAFIAAGFMTMMGGGSERAHYTAKDLMSRLVVGFIGAHFSTLLVGKAIELANGLVSGLAPGDTDRQGALASIKAHVHGVSMASMLLFLVLVVIIVVLLCATTIGMLVRFSALIVLAAAAPLALACHALPQTDAVARVWWRAFGGCLATPVLQAFTLQAGQWMLEDPTHVFPMLGIPNDPGSVINLFVVVILLWVTVKIPGMVRRYATQGGRGPNFLGAVVRVVIVQQITRNLPGTGRLAGRAVRAVAR
jgi:hypothetical protein